jgi:hypothetical protein
MITQDEARKQWIEALKSGKYPQIRHALHTIQGYCCLGVACELFSKELGIHREFHGGSESFDKKYSALPESLVELLGLKNSEGGCTTNGPYLTELNDHNGYDFNRIAEELESGKYWREYESTNS